MNKVQNIFGWIAAILSILGTILNAQAIASCFILWIISNIILIVINVKNKKWYMVAQFTFLTFISIYGYFNWLYLK